MFLGALALGTGATFARFHGSAPLAHWLSAPVPSPELCEYAVTDSACQPTTVTRRPFGRFLTQVRFKGIIAGGKEVPDPEVLAEKY